MVIQTLNGTVMSKEVLTDRVLLLRLKIPETFTFKAGQFASIKMTSDGVTKMKSYSICNPPSERAILDLCVKIIDGGFASEIFKKTKVGDVFEMRGPFGHFVFNEDDSSDEHWFLGAGTGVVPLYSMLKEYVSRFSQKKFVLLFGVRTKNDLFFDDEFKKLAKENSNFRYIPVLSREKWSGKAGHVQDHLPTDVKNKTFYICGLKELVLETKELLVQRGAPFEKIKSERYD